MSFTYNATNQTLFIIKAPGYADAADCGVPLDQILILQDHSDVQTPTEFHFPALTAAFFEGTTIEPPRFPLPDDCKVHVQLGNRRNHGSGFEVPQFACSLDVTFPWLELPGIHLLKTIDTDNSSNPPPFTSNVKHLLLSESACFNVHHALLPRTLETFILDYTSWFGDDDVSLNADELLVALPRTLETLAVVVVAYDVVEDTNFRSLDDFDQLRTLCVPAFLLQEELWAAMPQSIENLAINVHQWEHGEKVVEKMVEVLELLPNLRNLFVQGHDLEEVEEEELHKVAKENYVELTLCDSAASFSWPREPGQDLSLDAIEVYWSRKHPTHRVSMEFRKELF